MQVVARRSLDNARDLIGDWRGRLYLRWRDFGAPAPRIVVILSPQRCGSTWLFDGLRCHPAIEPQERYAGFAALASRGRRYPRDLVSDAPDVLQIEVAPGQWAGIPRFQIAHALSVAVSTMARYSIEKIHPHFFFWRTGRFLGRLRALEAAATIRLIYLVRAPGAALGSFLRYRARDPSWYPHVSAAEAPGFLWQDFRSLDEIARARPGIVVDYDELRTDFAGVLTSTFAAIWPESPTAGPQLAAAIEAATRPGMRAGHTNFFAAAARPEAAAEPWPRATVDQRLLADCNALYDAIRGRSGRV